MTVTLRLSLTVFSIGFGAESAGGFVALAAGATVLPFHGLLVVLNPAFSALGILLLWVGRHEWNELHRTRVGYVNLAFAASVVALALAAVPVGYLTITGGGSPTGWFALVFGASVAVVFGITFVTYALVAAHLVGRFGEVVMGLGLAWAFVISGLIGLALAPQLHPIVHALSERSVPLESLARPITSLDALLAFSYLAFLVAFLDAHYRVSRRLAPDGTPATPRGVRP
ncbi:MAG TPA: hypothetical protein VLY85_03895 [Thermoplasmata archaeon]|nr:hypothetical protein [Thermoplasmata archaeon]